MPRSAALSALSRQLQVERVEEAVTRRRYRSGVELARGGLERVRESVAARHHARHELRQQGALLVPCSSTNDHSGSRTPRQPALLAQLEGARLSKLRTGPVVREIERKLARLVRISLMYINITNGTRIVLCVTAVPCAASSASCVGALLCQLELGCPVLIRPARRARLEQESLISSSTASSI